MNLASKDMLLGYELPSLSKTVTQDRVDAFGRHARHPEDNIHTNEKYALSAGFPGTLVQGLLMYALVSQFLMGFFGRTWLTSGKVAMSFTKPVLSGKSLSVKAVIKEKAPEDSGVRIGLDVWCENEDGERVLTGTASALAQ